MKTKRLIIAIALLGCSSALFAGNCVNDLFKAAAQLPDAEKITLNPFVTGLIKPFVPEMKGINSMDIIDAEFITEKDYTRLEKMISRCNGDGYETAISSNEENELARIFMKIEKERIREVVIVSLDKDEISLIRIKGNIDPKHVGELIKDKE